MRVFFHFNICFSFFMHHNCEYSIYTYVNMHKFFIIKYFRMIFVSIQKNDDRSTKMYTLINGNLMDHFQNIANIYWVQRIFLI